VSHAHGTDSEIGALRTVLVHRPGPELRRLTPRSAGGLLLDAIPWVSRAQQEHDQFTELLRSHGVEVLYLTELLQDVLEYQRARDEAIASAVAGSRAGDQLGGQVRAHLAGLDPETLAQALIAGLTPGELRSGGGVVFELLDRHDFVVEPLPNLMFSRDSSAWIGGHVAVASLADAGRRREADLLAVIYRHHPAFAGAGCLYQPGDEPAEGGDVLLLAPGVVAIGVTSGTSPAGLERLARGTLNAGLAQTVLAVRVRDQLAGSRLDPAGPRLDTVCTLVDTGTVMMNPQLAYTLTAHTITARGGQLQISRPRPFLEAAAGALGLERLTVIGTGLDPVTGRGGQWDDGGNALALAPGRVVCQERAAETAARLEAAGIEVIRTPASELSGRRGGPRSLCCPVARDPAARPDPVAEVPAAVPVPAVRSRSAVTAPDLIVDPLAAELPAGLSSLSESRLPGAVVTLHPSTGRLAALCSHLAVTARGAVGFRTWSSRSHADLRVITRSCLSRANSICTPRLACTPS
jgi:arginine deiminase